MNTNKQLAINMFARIIAFAAGIGTSFFLTPYIIKNVGKEAYGFVGLANNFISYIGIITAALNSMASCFITNKIHQEDYRGANGYITSVFFANVIMAIPVTVLGTIIIVYIDKIVNISPEFLPDIRVLWSLLFANFIIELITNVFGVATYAKNRLDLSSFANMGANLLKVVILILSFICFEPHVWYLGLSTLVCSLFCIFCNINYTKKLLPFTEIKKKYIDLHKIMKLISSGIWNSIGKISSILTDGLDLLIINLFVGAAAMGTVSIAKTVPTLILSFFGMLAGIFMPQLNISYAKNNFTDMRNQLLFSIKMLGMISSIPIACLYAYGDIFFSLWVPGENSILLQKLAILSAAEFPFILMLEPIWNVFTVMNKIKYSTLFLISNSIASTIITFILLFFVDDITVKMYIVVGVSSLVAIVRAWTFIPIYTSRCTKIKVWEFYRAIIKNVIVLIFGTFISILARFVFKTDSWIKLIIICCLTATVMLVINYIVILNRNEKNMFINKIRRGVKK